MLLIVEMPILLVAGRIVLSRWLSKTNLGGTPQPDQVMHTVSVKSVSSKVDVDSNGNGTIGNGHAGRVKVERSKSTSESIVSVGETSINSARSAPAAAVNNGVDVDHVEVEPAVMPGLRVITSQTSTTSLV